MSTTYRAVLFLGLFTAISGTEARDLEAAPTGLDVISVPANNAADRAEQVLKDVNARITGRELDHQKKAPQSERLMLQETRDQEVLPATYGRRRTVPRPSGSHVQAPSPVSISLDRKVSMHLQGAELSIIIQALSADTGVNIIADQGLGAGKAVDIEVDDVPLGEFLSYVGRNFGIDFFYGKSTIWASAANPEKELPLETRVYHLRKGVQFNGTDWEVPAGKDKTPVTNSNSPITDLSNNAAVIPVNKSYIETIIERFVPVMKNAQLHFDRNTHTLFVRNTPANLKLIETIIDSLDVSPPQVFIEARFLEISQSDLQELGIDWILDSPLAVTKKALEIDGLRKRVPRTAIDSGTVFSTKPFTSDSEGTFPLGPQGSFGIASPGNPPTASQGLNISYRGILTEPAFRMVLHALEISGKGKMLSVPRVTTMNNTPAKLRDGEDLLYFDEFEAQAFTLLDEDNKRVTLTALIPKGKPLKEELGITLVAVPSVGADLESISLMLTPTISRLVRFVSYQDEDDTDGQNRQEVRNVVVKLPVIARREVQTKVQVGSGETVVMGGLIETVSQDTQHRIPLLGSIPGLGRLFRRDGITEERRNLLIFVTATVLSSRGESLVALQDE